MHLDTICASAVKLFRNPLLNQEKVKSYFFPKIGSPAPPPPPTPSQKTRSISNQWDLSIPWNSGSTLLDSEISRRRSSHHTFSRPVSPNRGSIWVKSYWLAQSQEESTFKKTVYPSGIFAETEFMGLLKAASSNPVLIRLEARLVDYQPIGIKIPR